MRKIFMVLLATLLFVSNLKKDINKATYAELDSIQGMGALKTSYLLAEINDRHFDSYDDFVNRTKGVIGEKTRERIKEKYSFRR